MLMAHWFIIVIRSLVRNPVKTQSDRGGGRIWYGEYLCSPTWSCLAGWGSSVHSVWIVTQPPKTARINHITSNSYVCTFILYLLKNHWLYRPILNFFLNRICLVSPCPRSGKGWTTSSKRLIPALKKQHIDQANAWLFPVRFKIAFFYIDLPFF